MKHPVNNNRFAQSLFPTNYPGSEVKLSKLEVPVVLLISSYPPRECGIATYSQDLLTALNQQFDGSFELQVCALESGFTDYQYPKEVTYTLNVDLPMEFGVLADKINADKRINLILIQHEFGLFRMDKGESFLMLIQSLKKRVVTVFHTVLPNPDATRNCHVQSIGLFSDSIIVMTNHAADILKNEYIIPSKKIAEKLGLRFDRQIILHGVLTDLFRMYRS